MTSVVHLPARGVIAVGGEDRVSFLQGLVSNDVTLAVPGQCVWAALLTPQGKWLADFFVFATPNLLLLDCETGQIDMLLQRLSRFRLRSQVAITARSDLAVFAAWDGPPPRDGMTAHDPRQPEAGHRVLSPAALPETATFAAWDRHRLALGLPDGSRDLEPEKTVLLEAGFDELNGVSWSKGCYMGQELTARTKYRGLVKRRLIPVHIHGLAPASGSAILRDNTEVGTMRSSCDDLGLALLRLDALRGPLISKETHIEPRVPAWMRLPEAAA
jgi:tRNA-modifying protein YgfZ